ncbi:DNA modification methylase [Sphingomonas sp. MG17]|uniref:Methyltransferase n=1 Tax=Sphingomonas tagetis TaxID=2949092 RepID=A0A9X2HRB7_9SPHN|nr:DNA modification methylase [Sphingomonas tagetis]MCP3732093.1 DNA modification methylase [Sphingomonas tagetis]
MDVPNTHSIEALPPEQIKLGKRWRKNPPEQIAEAARQLELTGTVVEPPLLDANDYVVCGGAIVQAAQRLKWPTIPVLRVNNMSPEELRLYAINAHKLSDMGGYDNAMLAEELRELAKLLGDDVLSRLAIPEGELTQLLGLAGGTADDDVDAALEREGIAPITRPGDLWKLGQHRLLCGTALEGWSYEAVMKDELAQFVLTDMPYNISMRTISSQPDREEFAFGHGEMSPNEFARFITTAMRHMKEASEPGSLHAFFMSYHFLLELLRAGTIVFGRPKALCTWVKSLPGQGSLFRSQTEQIAYFRNGDSPHRNNVQLGKHQRSRSTAWHYDGMTTASAERDETLKFHATPKPVLLLKDAILDVTSRTGIVLDPFAGIGSIILAAHSAERRAFAIEIEPGFVDVAIRRMRNAHGIDAIRESDGMSFSELETLQSEGA